MKGTLVFDIETHSANLLYTMPPAEFVRLIGYRWVGQETVLTTSLEEIRNEIYSARCVIGHNINAFDLPAVFGHRSDVPLQLAKAGRVYDTFTHASLVDPAPGEMKPGQALQWLGLDRLAERLGVGGKTDDIKALAYEFGPSEDGYGKAERTRLGFGRIPVTDERFRSYLQGDVLASEAVAQRLLQRGRLDDYALREQAVAAVAAVISSNGLRVDIAAAKARVEELAARRAVIMDEIVKKYGFPTGGLPRGRPPPARKLS